MENSSEEIDLWELLQKGFALFRERIKIVLMFFLLGLSYSISNFFIYPNKYRSFYKKDFIADSPIMPDEILADIINAIPDHIEQQSQTVSYFPHLKRLKAKPEANSKKETRLKVIIETFSKEAIDSVLMALENYIDAIDELDTKYQLLISQKKSVLKDLEDKIAACDSLKHDPINCNIMLEKKLSLEMELKSIKKIRFVPIHTDFIFVKNTRERVLNIIGWNFLGVVLGFLAAAVVNLTTKK